MPKRLLIDAMVADNPFSTANLLHGVAAYGRRVGGFRIAACLTSQAAATVEILRRSKSDGVLAHFHDASVADECLTLKKPVVNLYHLEFASRMPSVVVDDGAVGRVAAEHLLDRGHRNLAYYGPDYNISRDREAGFVAAARARGAKATSVLEAHPTLDWDTAYLPSSLWQFLNRLPKPLGLMNFNDQFAAVALEVCETHDLRVPDDVAIVGVDNNELRCEFSMTTISSISLNEQRFGEVAAELLHRLILGHAPPDRPIVVQPGAVVPRRSTDAMAFDDPDVRMAMHFLREQAMDGIGVEEVVKHVGISRSSLERRFRKQVGRLPGDELRRLRMAHACDLLTNTRLPLVQISTACGFEYLSNFSASFRQAMGMPPGAYRRRKISRAD